MKNSHPLAVFLSVFSAALVTAIAAEPVILLTGLVSGCLFAVLSGVRRPWLYFLIIPLSAGINPLFSGRGNTALFFFYNNAVTLEAILAGAASGTMLCAVLLWFAAYSRIMTTDKHLYLFGRFSPRLGLTLSAALRFVPLFIRRYREISMAQRAMGMQGEGRLTSRLSAMDASLTWALENGVVTAMSMSARGYGSGKRSSYSLFRFTWFDIFVCAAAPVLAAAVLYRSASLRFVFYPGLSPLPAGLWPRLAYGLLCALPLIAEIKERLSWKFSASKISALPITEPRTLF